jgi:hypothetical protein
LCSTHAQIRNSWSNGKITLFRWGKPDCAVIGPSCLPYLSAVRKIECSKPLERIRLTSNQRPCTVHLETHPEHMSATKDTRSALSRITPIYTTVTPDYAPALSPHRVLGLQAPKPRLIPSFPPAPILYFLREPSMTARTISHLILLAAVTGNLGP